ncbi:MAG: hypothetical protein NTY40_02785 [Synechococcus sp. LacPavin_0920_WC12_MAG_50_7]|nr:hypothetical protein [Synechococcus sp. LacPavin_0920_WC12_MAG_50_7]
MSTTVSPAAAKPSIYLGVVVILVWGLAPFYWMVVTAFRDPRYTFDTTPWPTHLTTSYLAEQISEP